jgi:hypothetical protein
VTKQGITLELKRQFWHSNQHHPIEVSRVLGGQVPVRDALQRAQAAAAAGMAAAGYTGKD